ncbi:hypothetical protein [Terrabacter terrigena]|uniref:Uncharacterized protein n=1 Tax=Terrabacter terrigena TaxID=574718 RepID=A0ABW3MZM5_9MICO
MGVPAPDASALVAALVELVGGELLVAGLGVVSLVLAVTGAGRLRVDALSRRVCLTPDLLVEPPAASSGALSAAAARVEG